MLGSSRTKSVFDERRAEAGGEIHALDFAAAERAGRAVEVEIAEADLGRGS